MSSFARRDFPAFLAAGLGAPRSAQAQPAGKMPRVGLLIHGQRPNPPLTPEQLAQSPLRQGLRALGWIHGENFAFETVFTEGQADRLANLAAELVRKQVDVIWCLGPPAAVAAARATKRIPVVFWGVGFPVELGLVASLARPGGNVTGMAHTPGPEIVSKLFQMLKTIVPKTARVAALLEAAGAQKVSGELFLPSAVVDAALQGLGIAARRFRIEDRAEMNQILADVREWKPDGILVVGDPATWIERQRIVDFANRNRLPGVFGMKDFATAGGLLSYGPNTADTVRQSMSYIDRILRGAKPADLPVEQPSKFELVVNLKTARAIGVAIPQAVLVRADEVIE